MNISENLEIKNLKRTGCSRGHIAQCIADKNLHGAPEYEYFGKRVQRGRMLLHTKKGDMVLRFRCNYGWLTNAELF